MLPRRATESRPSTSDRLTLLGVRRHSRVRVTRVSGRPRLVQRLAALGVVPGATLTVLRPHGPAMVALGGARIAIGNSAAQSVEVEPAE
jgi:Fe2+ transport system protein FeoA